MWKDKLQEIVQEKNLYGEKINIGATEEEIELFLKEAKAELKVDLPNDYVKILELVNGLEFNGFILYGIDRHLLSMQPNQSINGLIEHNKIWYENEWQKNCMRRYTLQMMVLYMQVGKKRQPCQVLHTAYFLRVKVESDDKAARMK